MTEESQMTIIDAVTELMKATMANEAHITGLTAEVRRCIDNQNAMIAVLEKLKPIVENLDTKDNETKE